MFGYNLREQCRARILVNNKTLKKFADKNNINPTSAGEHATVMAI